MEFQGNEMTVLLDVIGTLVGNLKLLGYPIQTAVKNHETHGVVESRAPKRTPRVAFLCNAWNEYLSLFSDV